MADLLNPTGAQLLAAYVDITEANGVQVQIREDGKVLWVNVDGVCVLRVCQTPIILTDNRPKDHHSPWRTD